MISPKPSGGGRRVYTGVILVLVCLVWLLGAVWYPLPFWQLSGDYSWYSLSHAITLEARVGGFEASNLGYKVHPGVPFGLASWVSLRLATPTSHGTEERIAYGIEHAEEYWLWAKTTALVVNLWGLFMMGFWFRPGCKHYLLAAGAFAAALPAWYHVALFQLSIESLALVYVTSVFAMGYLTLAPPSGVNAVMGRSVIGTDRLRDLSAVGVGAITAVGCSMKIYYMAPTIGLWCGALVAGGLGSLPWWRLGRSALLCAGGFVLTLACLVQTILDWSIFGEWFRWNWQMVSHAGRYGTAEAGFPSLSVVWDAMKDLSLSTSGSFPVLVAGACMFSGLAVWNHRHEWEWLGAYCPFACAVLVAIVINGVGFLKHYSPLSQHYGIIIAASLPCLVFIMAADQASKTPVTLFTWAVACFLAATLFNVASIHARQLSNSADVLSDLRLIESLPLADGERRVWAYFSPAKQGVVPLIAQYAGTRLVSHFVERAGGVDTVPDQYPQAEHWRYLVFPKSYYPTKEAVLRQYMDMFDFRSTRYRLTEKMKFTELKAFILVEQQEANEKS